MNGIARLHVSGVIRAPGDKSISHRALILAALAHGDTRVQDILESADVKATAEALRAMGVGIPPLSRDFVIRSGGLGALRSPVGPIDCANSGTTARLLCGLLAGLEGRVARLEGDSSLSRRPMRRLAEPLTVMGARIEFEGPPGHDGLPMRVHGARLRSTRHLNAHASAQVKGALLLAGLASGAEVIIEEPTRSRDHSERMLLARGVTLEVTDTTVRLPADQRVAAADVVVPSDPSSAVFFAALASLAHDGELVLENVCLNPTRTGAYDVLRRMGGSIQLKEQRLIGGELIGTLLVRPAALAGTIIGGREIPRCIDELPMLACLAARATGETVITDAGELRVKESDRIRAVVDNLRTLGADAHELPDGMRINGSQGRLRGHVTTHGDHRLAMAFGVLAALPGNDITIDDPGCVSVSYPCFWEDLSRATDHATRSSGEGLNNGYSRTLHASYEDASAGNSGHKFEEHPKTEYRPRLVIAIDGPAASGKSSTAQWVAKELGMRHVDSGAFYRAITMLALEAPLDPAQWTPGSVLANKDRISWRLTQLSVVPVINGVEQDVALRDEAVTREVSRVAQMQAVRNWVNGLVRSVTSVDVVVDGRDIGTVVFPTAQLKVFLTADIWERARRRLVQRLARRPTDSEIAVETEILVARDARDATQSVPARDAISVDTTALTQLEQVERIVALAHATMRRIDEG